MADYYFKRGEQIYGPVDFPGLQLQLGAGNVTVEDMLSHEPTGPWLPFLAMLPAFAPSETATATSNGAPTTTSNGAAAALSPSVTTGTATASSAPTASASPTVRDIVTFAKLRPYLWVITGLLAAMVLLTALRGASREQWEYKVVTPKQVSFALELNALGADGWEVVSARRSTEPTRVMTYEVIVKRRK